jgi:hypothetical protein
MIRKNGSSALKSSRSVIVVVVMGPFYAHAGRFAGRRPAVTGKDSLSLNLATIR